MLAPTVPPVGARFTTQINQQNMSVRSAAWSGASTSSSVRSAGTNHSSSLRSHSLVIAPMPYSASAASRISLSAAVGRTTMSFSQSQCEKSRAPPPPLPQAPPPRYSQMSTLSSNNQEDHRLRRPAGPPPPPPPRCPRAPTTKSPAAVAAVAPQAVCVLNGVARLSAGAAGYDREFEQLYKFPHDLPVVPAFMKTVKTYPSKTARNHAAAVSVKRSPPPPPPTG